MHAHFIDIQSRRLFIDGMIEILSMIFPLQDEVQKAALYNELTVLSDDDLIKKMETIEAYVEKTDATLKKYEYQAIAITHEAVEKEEKSHLSFQLNF
jgi:hypothetical protein